MFPFLFQIQDGFSRVRRVQPYCIYHAQALRGRMQVQFCSLLKKKFTGKGTKTEGKIRIQKQAKISR